jgi:diacylglycerol kinase family enzyme
MRVAMELDGRTIQVRSAGIGITNNLFGEGHLPYASDPAGGTLGVYITTSRSRGELLLFLLNILLGRWERNPLVEIHKAREVKLSFSRIHARHRCAIDGELAKLENPTTIRIHAGALRVLVPATASAAS